MSDPTDFPIKLDNIVRLAAERVKNGESLPNVIDDLMAPGDYKKMTSADKDKLVKEALFGAMFDVVVSFLENNREHFIDHIDKVHPNSRPAAETVIRSTTMQRVITAMIEVKSDEWWPR